MRFVLLFIVAFATSQAANAQVVRDFTAIYSDNVNGDLLIIGNTLQTCPAAATNCTDARAGTKADGNDDFTMEYVDIDGDPSTFNSSSADLTLPAGASVLFAHFYWGGRSESADREDALIETPASTGYVAVSDSAVDEFSDSTIGRYSELYSASVDVTTLVQAGGSGTYTAADIEGSEKSAGAAGWSMVVVYEVTGDPLRNITLFDGYAKVDNNLPVEVPVSGFLTPLNGTFTSFLAFSSVEGDIQFSGDGVELDVATTTTTLDNAVRPSNNFFNSSITDDTAHFTGKNPDYVNQMGWDAGTFDISSAMTNGATSATIRLLTTNDTYGPAFVGFSTEVFEPEIEAFKIGADLDGGSLQDGDIIEYTIEVTNTGEDTAEDVIIYDPIPTNTSYVPGSLQITAGAITGSMTDAAGDDQAEYS
ncbi:MAG: DUF11 domain-containing protein, partial [Proteobacteria bacterium]|nr:DUF11 domain-containing protein [Pseudomonadota bacterium]